MSFKKQKIKNKSIKNTSNSSKKNILNIIGIVSIGLIFILALFVVKNINLIKIKIDEQGIIASNSGVIVGENNYESSKNEDEKEESGSLISNIFGKDDKKEEVINILLTGVGGSNHDGGTLTDSILLAKIDTKEKVVSLLSIPRDLYVSYNSNFIAEGRINGIYSYYSNKGQNIDYGMAKLKSKVQEITGEKIDYYINIDFNGFVELIDAIGGITLEIPENFVDYEYPDGNGGYRTLVFRKGTWLFSGENTLKYVRSRHSTSDFDRSLRQQKVIMAIKDKLSGSFFLTSPGKIKELYDVFTSNVKTDISLTKVISLAYLINSKDELKIYSSNMNDSCFYDSLNCSKGGILYTPMRDLFDGQSVLLINGTEKGRLSNYILSKKYAEIVFKYPKIQEENYKINILNSTGEPGLALNLSYSMKRFGFLMPDSNFLGNTNELYPKSVIYYNNIDPNSDTIKAIKKFYNGELIEIDYPKYSKNDANIEVIIGKDYINNNLIYNF